ncbi:MAG: 2-aminoethylphosphonate-pyruvate transaminase [Myxococcota bacterium]|jgi:2-aminoethylphosphonate-pyruvate transaminase
MSSSRIARPPRVTTAAIVAAGFGSRLNELTEQKPKGFLELAGHTLIERSLDALRHFGITKVVVGTGYRADFYERLAGRRGDMVCIHSDIFATTSSMYTLYNMRSALEGPFLLLESDLLFEPSAIQTLLENPHGDVVLASDATGSGDEVYIETTDAGGLVGMSKDKTKLGRVDAELVGISKISDETYRGICEVMEAALTTNPKLDYEGALVELAKHRDIRVQRVDGLAWCEIDDSDHLEHAVTRILPRVQAAWRAKNEAA